MQARGPLGFAATRTAPNPCSLPSRLRLAAGEGALTAMTSARPDSASSQRSRGDDHEALRFYESALSDARGAALVDQEQTALFNLGYLHTHMNRLAEADHALAEAKDACVSVGDISRLIRIELLVARVRIKQGEQHAARASWERATELITQTGDTSAYGDADRIRRCAARRRRTT